MINKKIDIISILKGKLIEMSHSASVSKRFNVYKNNAYKRSLDFELTYSEFDQLTSKKCEYCGGFSKLDKYGNQHNGIDRKNNNKGYIKKNCAPCCWVCNKMKSTLGTREFLDHTRKIIKYRNKN
ncbi:MAG: hypothetical protein WC523_03915 [Patescibacteria group bacterium]